MSASKGRHIMIAAVAAVIVGVSAGCAAAPASISAPPTKNIGQCPVSPMPTDVGDVAPSDSKAPDQGRSAIRVDDVGTYGSLISSADVNADHTACVIVEGDIGDYANVMVDGLGSTLIIHGHKIAPTATWGAMRGGKVYLSNIDAASYKAIKAGYKGGIVIGKDGVVLQP